MKLSDLPPNPATLERSSSAVSEVETNLVLATTSSQTQKQPVERSHQGTFAVFSSTFLTIFLAEIGDKTQVATLLMSAQSQSPWVVFAGAATALIATSLVGVLLGRWLSTKLSPKTLDSAAGVTLLFISVLLLWEVVMS